MPDDMPAPIRADPPDERGRIALDRYLAWRFPAGVPSPIRQIVRVRLVRGHLAARVVLFDGGPCLLIVSNAFADDEERWIYRGLARGHDTRPFFFHRMRNCWMRNDGSKKENLERHRLNLV